MNAVEIIERATVEGITLTLSPVGTITAIGDQATINRWLPLIRKQKPEIVTELKREPVTSQKHLTETKCENPATQDEKLLELDSLIQYIAEHNDFSKEDIEEAKFHATRDIKNALTSFRALARTIRRDRAMELLKASPESLRAIHIDSDSDPKNIILTTALRHVAIFEMVVSHPRYDSWKMMNILGGEVH